MACENIRSDHIGVLLEVYQKVELNSVTLEKYLISKAKRHVVCTQRNHLTNHILCENSKEPLQLDGSSEHTKQMLKKKIITYLRTKAI